MHATMATVLLLAVHGCSSLVVSPMLEPLQRSMESQTDLELVLDGAPSLLLVLDGFITKSPENRHLLLYGTRAYASYALALQANGEEARAVRLSAKAKEYGLRLLQRLPPFAGRWPQTTADLEHTLTACSRTEVEALFWAAQGWGTWIELQSGAPAAMADLAWVEKIMERVVTLNEAYYYGGAHLFLGVVHGSRPSILGGKPELSRHHFERALALADRKFLLTQVLYAQTYARMTWNRELFEQLLTEVLTETADSEPAVTTANQLARMKARTLLDQADALF